MIYAKMLQKILKINLVLQIMNQIGHYLTQKIEKVIGLTKNELGGKIMTKFVGLRTKKYSYLIDNAVKIKKAKST